MFKITFVTTGHLYSNPRLVKELSTAAQNDWTGDVIYVQTLASLVHHDLEIQKRFPGFNFTAIAWYKKSKLERGILKAIQSVLQKLNPIYFHVYGRALFQRALKANSNCIIGHNLGTLPIVHVVSQKKNIPFIFDVEDYHPGETENIEEQKKRERILQKYLPDARSITYASPLIGEKIRELLGEEMPHSILINNTFLSTEFQPPSLQTGKIKMVWFSQTISFRRGLELAIEAIKPFSDKIQLTLIGHQDPNFITTWVLPNKHFIELIDPVSQLELHLKLAKYDIGLALELLDRDLNNRIALSNKIWSYLLSGLYIIATETPAQSLFMSENQEHGKLAPPTVEGLELAFSYAFESIDSIRKSASKRYETAMMRSREVEQQKWESVISSLYGQS